MQTDELANSVQKLSAKQLETLLQQRQAQDKALRVLWRAALAREREERRQGRNERDGGNSTPTVKQNRKLP
jgi:hypothetical protein